MAEQVSSGAGVGAQAGQASDPALLAPTHTEPNSCGSCPHGVDSLRADGQETHGKEYTSTKSGKECEESGCYV